MKYLKALVPALFLCTTPAFAAPFVYAPADCEFQATFPEKPFIEQKCLKDKPCEEIVTYTQTVEASSINFRMVCKKEDSKVIADYKPESLKATLEQMVKDAGLKLYTQDTATVENDVKTSMALATGVRNDREVLYAGQIWLGKTSSMTVEGEMSGPQNVAMDKVYASVLNSIKIKGAPDKPKVPAPVPAPEAKKPDPKKKP